MEPKREEVVEGGQAAAMAAPRARRPSQGKQRIQIRLIDNKDRRQVTFSKRRKGLFKKASELAQLCGARVAVVVFSPSERSKAFAIGAPSVDAVLRAYVPGNGGEGAWLLQDADDAACRAAVEAALRRADETKARVVAEKARMDAVGEKVLRATPGGRFWWEADVDQLGEPELTEFARALQRLRDNVQRHTDQFGTVAAPPLRLQ